MHHTDFMERGAPQLSIAIALDSGTDEFVGIRGTMTIDTKDGTHFYAVKYSQP